MYVGAWWHHGMTFTITKMSEFPEDGFAIAQWRTYTWCQDAFSHTTNPPPCDMTLGHMIEDGGIASIALVHVQGQDDRYLSGTIGATSDPDSGFGGPHGRLGHRAVPGDFAILGTAGAFIAAADQCVKAGLPVPRVWSTGTEGQGDSEAERQAAS
jgi:hypothetical protein